MNLINLFIIILILYVCYKIVVFENKDIKEPFESINLEGKNIFLGRNLFVGVNQNEVDNYNRLKNKDGSNVLDLSKNNMIIKNNQNFKIEKNICFDNFCVNGKQMELIGGEIDAPSFRKEEVEEDGNLVEKSVYYNHDSETSFRDLPNKMCFKNKDEETEETDFTCLDYNDFEILNGERGIKLQSTKSPNYIVENPSFMELLGSEIEIYNSKPDESQYLEFLNNLQTYISRLTSILSKLKSKYSLEKIFISGTNPELEILSSVMNKIDNIISNVNSPDTSGVSNKDFVTTNINNLMDASSQLITDKDSELLNEFNKDINNISDVKGLIDDYLSPNPIDDVGDKMFYLLRESVNISNINEKQFLMPYYIDFRKRGTGVANVKDQLFFKENYNCAENNSFYQKNPSFDQLKYPYIKEFDYGEKCADIPREELCQNGNSNPEGRFCYNTCCGPDNPSPPDWCPTAGSGVEPTVKYLSNKINTDQYPIDIKNSVLGDQRDDSRRHGYFKVDESYRDPRYEGYYVSRGNNNTKFDTKQNLFTELSNFFGIDVNHRASHNGVCGKYGSLTKTKNFCNGKNAYDPEFESECNRVSKYRKDLYDKKVEENEAAENNNSNGITDMATDPVETDPVETEPVQTTMSVEEQLDNLPELNFYIQPAKGEDGNILRPNTYFHAHEHIHS